MNKKKEQMNLAELKIVLEVGDFIINEIKKKFPKMEIDKEYDGVFKKYIDEYLKEFIMPDVKASKTKKDLDTIKEELWQEIAFITCFCKWLEEEKGVSIK